MARALRFVALACCAGLHAGATAAAPGRPLHPRKELTMKGNKPCPPGYKANKPAGKPASAHAKRAMQPARRQAPRGR